MKLFHPVLSSPPFVSHLNSPPPSFFPSLPFPFLSFRSLPLSPRVDMTTTNADSRRPSLQSTRSRYVWRIIDCILPIPSSSQHYFVTHNCCRCISTSLHFYCFTMPNTTQCSLSSLVFHTISGIFTPAALICRPHLPSLRPSRREWHHRHPRRQSRTRNTLPEDLLLLRPRS